jgi:DNA-binding MurR/RpiR family transcriptional regulator
VTGFGERSLNVVDLPIVKLINAKFQEMTAGQKTVAQYIVNYIAEAAFMTISELAKECRVSEASVVRFAKAMGFDGFPQLKQAIQEAFRSKVNLATKLENTLENIHSNQNLFTKIVRDELAQIDRLMNESIEDTFLQSVKVIAEVDNLVIYGEGASTSLTRLLEFRLRRFRYNILIINESGKDFFEKVVCFPKNAVAIAYNLGRPSEELVVFLEQARKKKCTTILIADSHLSMITKKADLVLSAIRDSLGLFHSIVVPTILTEALILGVAFERRNFVIEALKELEDLRSKYGYPRLASLDEHEVVN